MDEAETSSAPSGPTDHPAFPSLRNDPLTPLPTGILSQFTYVPRSELLEFFNGHPTYYSPKKLDPWVKLHGDAKTQDGLLQNAQLTASLAFGPVIQLADKFPNEETHCLTTLAITQTINRLDFIRRMNVLKNTGWSANSAKEVLQRAEEEKAFTDDTLLFGGNFSKLSGEAQKPVDPKGPTQTNQRFNPYGRKRLVFEKFRHYYPQVSRPISNHNFEPPVLKGKSKIAHKIVEGLESSAYVDIPADLEIPKSPHDPIEESLQGEKRFFPDMALDGPVCTPVAIANRRPDTIVVGKRGKTELPGKSPKSSVSEVSCRKGTEGPNELHVDGTEKYGDHQEMQCPKIRVRVIPEAKAKREVSIDNRSFKLEQVPQKGGLQDGESQSSAGFDGTRRLHDKNRPPKCLLQRSNSWGPPGLPSLPVGGRDMEIYTPMLRSITCPQNFHKANETSFGRNEKDGSKVDRLPGRLLDLSSGQRDVPEPGQNPINKAGELGICSQPRKEYVDTSDSSNILRDGTILRNNDHKSSPTKERKAPSAAHRNGEPEGNLVPEHDAPHRGSGGHQTSILDGPSLLQRDTEMDDKSPDQIKPCANKGTVASNAPTVRRTEVLDTADTSTETPENHQVSRFSNPSVLGCKPLRLGSYSKLKCGSWKMVQNRKNHEHKCSRAISNLQGSRKFCNISTGKKCDNLRRQYYQPRVHKEKGGNQKPPPVQPVRKNLGTSPEVRYKPGSGTHSRGAECYSRSPEQTPPTGLDREQGMEVVQCTIQTDSDPLGSAEHRPVCKSPKPPTPKLHNLETAACPDKRISPQVGGQGLRFPAIHTNPESATESAKRPVLNSSNSTKMGIPALVPDTPEHAMGLTSNVRVPQEASTGHDPQPSSSGTSIAFDGLACYRQRKQAEGISEEVTEVLTQSWRPSTNTKYQACWKKWAEFCENGRNINPASPTNIGTLMDFLYEMRESGMAYSTLCGYKAALSSYLPEIQGKKFADHEVVKTFMRAAYKSNPPRAKYDSTWDVEPVVKSWDIANSDLSLLDLSMKTFTLCAIGTMGRSADLRSLSATDYKLIQDKDGEIVALDLLRLRLPKGQRSGPLLPVRIYSAPENMSNICPVRACMLYIGKTRDIRHSSTEELFISTRTPFKAISAKTASRWLTTSMEKGGIDTSKFKPHSVCGASVSNKVKAGASITSILNNGRWKTESTLRRHYLRAI